MVLKAVDSGPDHEFDAGLVALARREVERMRMLEWEITTGDLKWPPHEAGPLAEAAGRDPARADEFPRDLQS